MLHRFIALIIFISLTTNNLFGQNRSIWATIWSINSSEKIDKIIETAKKYNFNQIFIQTRYRADALYFPNRTDSTFINNEPRSYILKESNFDPLEYLINKVENTNIEVHAWVPVFILTPHNLLKIDTNHLYYQHPEWVTVNNKGKIMDYNEHEGAFLDPGIPEVQQYMLNVIGDIARNYKVAGIQLDYIRYPDSIYGYNPLAIENFKLSGDTNFAQWKEEQISGFVNKVFIELKNINPELKLSAAVFGNQDKAIKSLSQNWKNWLDDSYIDNIYVMAYNISDVSFENVIKSIDDVNRNKSTIVLRAWKDKSPYYSSQINEKINISKRYGFYNLGFYSYSGLITNHYLRHIKF